MLAGKHSERKVLNGKIGAGPIGGFDPTGQRRIVRGVQKRKWFQVTRSRSQTLRRHATAQSFAARIAGCRPFNSPPLSFEQLRIKASGLTCQLFLAGTGISKRPFTLPKRLPVSRPPFRGRSSRPASSTPYRSFVLPVRIPIPLRAPVRPGCAQASIPKSRCLTPARHSQPFLGSPLPFGVFRTLKDQSVQPDSRPGSSPSERSRLPVTPRHRIYFISADTRSPLQAR